MSDQLSTSGPATLALPAAAIEHIVSAVTTVLRDVLAGLRVPLPETQHGPADRSAPQHASGDLKQRTPARRALLERDYPRGPSAADITAAINALPGAPMTTHGVMSWASLLGLSAARRAGKTSPASRAPSEPAPEQDADGSLRRRTAMRAAVLRVEWGAGTPRDEIERKLNAMPGPPLTVRQIKEWAGDLRLSRPDRRAPEPVRRSPARREIVAREYAKGTSIDEILRMVNALPGPPMLRSHIAVWAAELKIRRPAQGALPAQPAPALPVKSAPAVSAPAATSPTLPLPKNPPKIAPYVPAAAAGVAALPLPLTGRQRQRQQEQALIDQHVATRGVTRCPTAVAAVTTATPKPEDAAALRAYTDERNALANAEVTARVERTKRAREAKLRCKLPERRTHG